MIFRKILKVIKIIITVLLFLILAVNLYIIGDRLLFNNELTKVFGYAQVVVLSGSMSPALEIGDMVIIHEEPDYAVNDIVTYRSNNTLITHRIVKIVGSQDKKYITKGDYNNVSDDSVPLSAIQGKAVLRLPGFGNVTFFLRTPQGAVCMILGIFLLIEVPIWIGKSKRSKK